jgi:hypothetical protein
MVLPTCPLPFTEARADGRAQAGRRCSAAGSSRPSYDTVRYADTWIHSHIVFRVMIAVLQTSRMPVPALGLRKVPLRRASPPAPLRASHLSHPPVQAWFAHRVLAPVEMPARRAPSARASRHHQLTRPLIPPARSISAQHR